MSPHLTQDHVVTLILVCLVVGFLAAEKILKACVLDPMTKSSNVTKGQVQKLSRVSAATVVMHFVSVLVKIMSGVALAIGLLKPFGVLAALLLPEHALGFSLLISYCGLASVVAVIGDDLVKGMKKLFIS